MKQKIAIIIAGSILVLSFSLTGCGSEQQTSSETESASQTVSQQSSSKTSSNINTSQQVINSVSKKVNVTIPEGFTWDLIAKRLEAKDI